MRWNNPRFSLPFMVKNHPIFIVNQCSFSWLTFLYLPVTLSSRLTLLCLPVTLSSRLTLLCLPVTLSSRLLVSSPRNNVKFPAYFLQDQKTAQEICAEFGLNDVELEYAEEDFKIMTNYKVFSQQIRPLIAAENPKIPMSKVVMLIGAKWREFLTLNPNKDSIEAVEREAAKQAAAAVASGGQIEPLTEADADVADVTAPTDGK